MRWQTGVFYEIYVRSFQDADGDGVGDLGGIIDRLDYLNDGTPETFVYLREHDKQRLLLALNFGQAPCSVALPPPAAGAIVLGTDPSRGGAVSETVTLGPVEGVVVELEAG